MMKITDMNGFDIEIDDLQLALMQADDYRHMKHLNPDYQALDTNYRRIGTMSIKNYCGYKPKKE